MSALLANPQPRGVGLGLLQAKINHEPVNFFPNGVSVAAPAPQPSAPPQPGDFLPLQSSGSSAPDTGFHQYNFGGNIVSCTTMGTFTSCF
jgi:hypothetical protein